MSAIKEIQEEKDLIIELISVNKIKRKSAIGRAMMDKYDNNVKVLERIKARLESHLERRDKEVKSQTTLF